MVSADDYDAMEDFTAGFFEHLARRWPRPSIAGVRLMHEFGRWLDDQGLGGAIAATCARHDVPLFVPAAVDGPLSEGYRTAKARRANGRASRNPSTPASLTRASGVNDSETK